MACSNISKVQICKAVSQLCAPVVFLSLACLQAHSFSSFSHLTPPSSVKGEGALYEPLKRTNFKKIQSLSENF